MKFSKGDKIRAINKELHMSDNFGTIVDIEDGEYVVDYVVTIPKQKKSKKVREKLIPYMVDDFFELVTA